MEFGRYRGIADFGEPKDLGRIGPPLGDERRSDDALRQPVLLALYNTIGEILLTVPAVLAAMYAEPSFNVTLWHALVERWEQNAMTEAGVEEASGALSAFHVACVERFQRALV